LISLRYKARSFSANRRADDSIRAFVAIALVAITDEASHFSPLDGSISLAASDLSRSDRSLAIVVPREHDTCRVGFAEAIHGAAARRWNLPGSFPMSPSSHLPTTR